MDALKLLPEVSQQLGTVIHHQPGARIGLLISDDIALIFTPILLLVEGDWEPQTRPNTIRLESIPPNMAQEVGLGPPGAVDQTIGRESVSPATIEAIANDLADNCPLKFDIARKVQIFKTQFEFVEFELCGCRISHSGVPIPSDLINLARDPNTQKHLRSTFQLIDDESELSGEEILKRKQQLAKEYLNPLKGYGNIILRANKPAFEKAIQKLQHGVTCFQRRVKEKLQQAIADNRASLVDMLLPAVRENHQLGGPGTWARAPSQKLSENR